MNSPMTAIRSNSVLVAYTNSSSAREIEDVLSLSSRFQTSLVELGKLISVEKATPADVIVIDLEIVNDKELDILADVRVRFSGTPLIIVSEALTESQMRRLFQLHVHDWLPKPLDKKQFHASLQNAVRDTTSTTSMAHAVVSASGGAGATSIAISLAQILAKPKGKTKPTVALFDLDFSSGNCGYVLNQPNGFGIDSVIENPSRIDAEFVNIIRQRHSGNFDIFSFKRPDVVTENRSSELVLRMLDAVSVQHEHTILDVPYYETAWKDEVLSAVNSITIVTEMNLPSLKHTKELLERIRALRTDKFAVNIVINKYESSWLGSSISSKALKELFGDVPVYWFHRDASTLTESFDRGILPFEVNVRSKFLKDLNKYVKKSKIAE
jgi:pilus assembly protein CpaE